MPTREMTVPIPPESEWLSSERMSDDEGDTDSDGDMGEPPVHPVPTMQGAFEESMAETLEEAEDPDAPDRMSIADSVSRRKTLLEQEEYERTVAGRWKQKPGEKFHPLWKLVAQISFGMHLLQQGMAKSDEEVIKILQTHVDEIDGFLERTTEDFDLAQNDIDERIRYLRLPLEHGGVFDTMLNDRSFRVAIVEGNEKIEHIIDRTAAAMTDALKDVQKGLDATRELAKYLTRVDKNWDDRTEEHDSVYLAMIGNTEGWTRAFLTLQSKGNHLRKGLVQLGGIVAEMQRRAGAASRRNLAPKPAQGRYHVEPKTSSTTPQGSISPKSPRKPLPTAPNAEAKAPRIPKDASPLQHPSSRKHSSSSQQPLFGQQSSVHQLSSPTRHADPGQHPALRQHASSPQSRSPGQQSHFRRQSESSQRPDSAQTSSPKQYQSPVQHETSRRRVPSTDWNSPAQDEKFILRDSSNDWAQNPMASPLIEHAMSAKRVSPVMRMHSTDRVPLPKSPETPMPVKASDPKQPSTPKPLVPERSSSLSRPSNERKSLVSQELSRVPDDSKQTPAANESNASHPTIEREPSGPDLPIQRPTEHDPPPPSKSPPTVKRVPSHRITILSTTSDYSRGTTSPRRSVESPVTRETSPVLHRNSQGPAPNHKSYGSISFLPMHPLLSPLQDSSDWAADAEREFERRTSDPPKVPAPGQIPRPQPIPAPDDSEGAINASHPLLLAERHTRFAPKTNPSNPKNGRDLPLRHYHSQEVVRRSIFSPSDEKEVFVPPKRSSSLVWDHPNRVSAAMNSSLSLPLANTNLSPPPDSSSAAPSPLNVTQTKRSLTPQPANVLKSSKASIVEIPSSESVSTATSPSHNATPPAISHSRSSIPQSKSTPNLAITQLSPSDEPVSAAKYNTSATNNTPIYLNPVSSTALIDFLASTPPPTPPGRRAHSPAKVANKEKHGANDKHTGPFSIFPSSFRPSSPGGRALASLNIPRDGQKTTPAPGATSASPNENKKGFKKFFGGGGSKKAKGAKQDAVEGLGLVIPEHERYRTKKRTGMKGHKKGGSKDEVEVKVKKEGANGEEGGGGGFMGVGKDGVWISKKNFLKT